MLSLALIIVERHSAIRNSDLLSNSNYMRGHTKIEISITLLHCRTLRDDAKRRSDIVSTESNRESSATAFCRNCSARQPANKTPANRMASEAHPKTGWPALANPFEPDRELLFPRGRDCQDLKRMVLHRH